MKRKDFDYSILDNPPEFNPPEFEFKGCKKLDNVPNPFDFIKTKAFKLPPPPFPEDKRIKFPEPKQKQNGQDEDKDQDRGQVQQHRKLDDDIDNNNDVGDGVADDTKPANDIKPSSDENNVDDNNDDNKNDKVEVESDNEAKQEQEQENEQKQQNDIMNKPLQQQQPQEERKDDDDNEIDENEFKTYLELLDDKKEEKQKEGVIGLTESKSFARYWTKKANKDVLMRFLGNAKGYSHDFHPLISKLLVEILGCTNEAEQEKVAEEIVKNILNVKSDDRGSYADIFSSFEAKVVREKIVPILVGDDNNADFYKECFGKSKLDINDYFAIVLKKENNSVIIRVVLGIMNDLAIPQGTKFVENGGIQNISDLLVNLQKPKLKMIKKFLKLFSSDESAKVIETVKEIYKKILENATFRACDVEAFVSKWRDNKGVSEYDKFCKDNYRKLLRGDNQLIFVESGGLELVYDDIKIKDIDERVWKGVGVKKIFSMDFDKSEKLLKDNTLWNYFKEGIKVLEKDSAKKFDFLYKLVLARSEKNADEVTILDPLYKDSVDNDAKWKAIIEGIAKESKSRAYQNKYVSIAILKMFKGFVAYMPITLSGKNIYNEIISTIKKIDDQAVFSESLEVIEKVHVGKGVIDVNDVSTILDRSEKASPADKKRVIDIVHGFTQSVTKASPKLNVDKIIALESNLPADSIRESVEKVVFILTKANPTKNEAGMRAKMGKFILKYIDTFQLNLLLCALKVYYNYCFAQTVVLSKSEYDAIFKTVNDVLAKKKDNPSILHICLYIVAALVKKYDVDPPKDIKSIAVKSVKMDKSVVLNAFMLILSAKGVIEPELLDGDLKPFVDNFDVKILYNILYNANKKAGAHKSFGFPQIVIRKIFSIRNFADEVGKKPFILDLLYEVVRFDNASDEFIRSVGGIRMLTNLRMSMHTVKILEYLIKREENAYAFYNCGGVRMIMAALRDRKSMNIKDDMINRIGKILYRMCEFNAPCTEVARSLGTVYEIAVNGPNESNKVVYTCILARVYCAVIGHLNITVGEISKLLDSQKSIELMKLRLNAMKYALYSTNSPLDFDLSRLRPYKDKPELNEMVKEIVRIASRGNFELTYSYLTDFEK